MEKLTDLELIEKVKVDNDSDSFVELSRRHTPLCKNIYNRYQSSITSSGLCFEDVKDEKDNVIYKALMSYQPDKNVKFSTWLGNSVKYHCLNSINSNGRTIAMEEKDLVKVSDSQDLVKANENIEIEQKEYVYNILNQLSDERIRKIFMLRFFSNSPKKKSWSKIGEEIGVSTQTALNLYRKGLKILKIKVKNS